MVHALQKFLVPSPAVFCGRDWMLSISAEMVETAIDFSSGMNRRSRLARFGTAGDVMQGTWLLADVNAISCILGSNWRGTRRRYIRCHRR